MWQPTASIRPVMVYRSETPPSGVPSGFSLNRPSRTGPFTVMNQGTVFVAPASVASATCGLTAGDVPPTVGCAWHEAQLFPLNLGPRPGSVFGTNCSPSTDCSSDLSSNPAAKNFDSRGVMPGSDPPTPDGPGRTPGSLAAKAPASGANANANATMRYCRHMPSEARWVVTARAIEAPCVLRTTGSRRIDLALALRQHPAVPPGRGLATRREPPGRPGGTGAANRNPGTARGPPTRSGHDRSEHRRPRVADDPGGKDGRRRGADDVSPRHERGDRRQGPAPPRRSRDRGGDHRKDVPVLLPAERSARDRRGAAGRGLRGPGRARRAARHRWQARPAIRPRRGGESGPHGALRARRGAVGRARRSSRFAARDIARREAEADPRVQLERARAHVTRGCRRRGREAARRRLPLGEAAARPSHPRAGPRSDARGPQAAA